MGKVHSKSQGRHDLAKPPGNCLEIFLGGHAYQRLCERLGQKSYMAWIEELNRNFNSGTFIAAQHDAKPHLRFYDRNGASFILGSSAKEGVYQAITFMFELPPHGKERQMRVKWLPKPRPA